MERPTNFNSKSPSHTALKDITASADRNWYFKNPNTMLQYQMAVSNKTIGTTTLKNSYVYYYKNGENIPEVRTFYMSSNNIWSNGANDSYATLAQKTEPSNSAWNEVMRFQIYYGSNNGENLNAVTAFNESNFTESAKTYFNSILSEEMYSSAIDSSGTTIQKGYNDCYSVVSTSSSTQKKYITNENVNIQELSLSGFMLPKIKADISQTESKQMSLSQSLSDNGLTASSAIPRITYTKNRSTFKYHLDTEHKYYDYVYYYYNCRSSDKDLVYPLECRDAVASPNMTSSPSDMITYTTAASYADGNGSTLSNGVYYNTPSGYAKNNLYVAKGAVQNETGSVGNNFQVRPEFVLLEHPQRKALKKPAAHSGTTGFSMFHLRTRVGCDLTSTSHCTNNTVFQSTHPYRVRRQKCTKVSVCFMHSA